MCRALDSAEKSRSGVEQVDLTSLRLRSRYAAWYIRGRTRGRGLHGETEGAVSSYTEAHGDHDD